MNEISPSTKFKVKEGDMIINMELQQPLINGSSKTSPPTWKDLENIIKMSDTQKLVTLLEDHSDNRSVVFNPPKSRQEKSLFHLGVQEGSYECLKILVHSSGSKNFINKPDVDGMTPLHYAAKEGKLAILKLLIESSANVNARNSGGNSALHILADRISNNKEDQAVTIECLDGLLEDTDIDLDPRNNSRQSPLMIAVEKMSSSGHDKIDSVVLTFCRRLVSKGASLELTNFRGFTIEELLDEKKAKVSILSCNRQNPPQRPLLSQFFDALILEEDISQSKYRFVLQKASNMWLGKYTILQYLVVDGNKKSIEVLLKAGANPSLKFETGENIVLHHAISNGRFNILNLLITYIKKTEHINVIDIKKNSFNMLNNLLVNFKNSDGEEINYVECLKILLSDDFEIDLNQKESKRIQRSVLHVAARLNNQEAMKMLLIVGAHLGCELIVDDTSRGNVLPALRPATLNDAWDGCVKHVPPLKAETSILDPEYKLSLDYTSLVHPRQREDGTWGELETLMDIKKNKQHRRSLVHPLIQTLLYMKSEKTLPLYLLNSSIYFSFVCVLIWYVYTLRDLRILEKRKELNISGFSFTPPMEIEEQISYYYNISYIAVALIIPFTIYILIREIFQIIFTKREYVKNAENWLEMVLLILVVTISFVPLNSEQTKHISAWAVIAAGYNLILIIGRIPKLAIYVHMMRNVAWNFVRMILLYSGLIVVFTISFNIILYPTVPPEEPTDFISVWTSLPKALVMATGEFDYGDLNDEFPKNAVYAVSAVLLFLAFVFLIFLVLLNIMTGLAVQDTQQVIEDANLYSLTSRLEMIYLMDELFRIVPFLKNQRDRLRVFPVNGPYKLNVFFNAEEKGKRVTLQNGTHCFKLDNHTTNVIKEYWLERLQEDKPTPLKVCESRLEKIENMLTKLSKEKQ